MGLAMKKIPIRVLLLLIIASMACLVVNGTAEGADEKKKILYVDSYHPEYLWVQEITEGILRGLNISVTDDSFIDDSQSRVKLKIVHMDTKRNKSEDFKKQAALRVKEIIDAWKPDIVIASDDNASKYLIVPYYKNVDLPFVFCGINWDASSYGYPFHNVTGMVEVGLLEPMLNILRDYAKGEKIGFIGMDALSDRKDADAYKKIFHLHLTAHYVNSFEEWRAAYGMMQDEVDLLILGNVTGMAGWDHAAAQEFVVNATKIPTGTINRAMTEYTLTGFIKRGSEQGEWAAHTALQILDGKRPGDIPLTTNKKAKIFVNMDIAEKLDILLPARLIKYSTLIQKKRRETYPE
jgi:hypothetical protein